MTIGDIDIYEVNEAFAPVPLAWLQAIGGDPAKLNVNGGAGFVRATAGRLRWAQQAQTQAAIRPRGRSTRPTRRSAFVCKPGG